MTTKPLALQRKLTAILSADVKDYSRLRAEIMDAASRFLQRLNREFYPFEI